MKVAKLYFLMSLLGFLIFFGAEIILNHMKMQKELDPIQMRFEAVVLDHYQNRAPYAGRVDKIIGERNEMLRGARYLWVGTWSAGPGFGPFYMKASWLPNELYQYAWGQSNKPSGKVADSLAMTLIIVPLLAYLGAFVFAVWLTWHFFKSRRAW